jgi:hypothetical protein
VHFHRSVTICISKKTEVQGLQFNINMHDLEICKVQGPSFPKSDPIHLLVNQKIIISWGPLKGLYGCIKQVGSEALSIKLEVKVTSSTNSCQPMKWTNLTLVWVSILIQLLLCLFLFKPKTVKTSGSATNV